MENLSTLPLGTIIQGTQYRIDEVLGQGSFGITYKISDQMLGRVYALKEFFPQDIADRNTSVSLMLTPNRSRQFEDLKKKFISEAKALADCNHPGIVKILDVLTPNTNSIYYRMDYIEGVTLNKKYENHPINLKDAGAMILKIAEPLKYIHNLSDPIAHYDLNPNNVMLRRDSSVVLIDFGFAKRYDSTGKQKSSLLVAGGTPGYIAPEQMGGVIKEFTASVDIYALGGIFYFLLTGMNPPDCMELLQDFDQLLSNLPEETRPFFEKAMSMRKKDRFATIDEFCNELVDICGIKRVDTAPERNNVSLPEHPVSDESVFSLLCFDEAKIFQEGFAAVKKKGKWNFITKEGKYISHNWFEHVLLFQEGFAAIKHNGKWNFINFEGELISQKWWDEVESFSQGRAAVKKNGKWNFINSVGTYISNNWFDKTSLLFLEDRAAVKINGKWNFIDRGGKYISDKWFDNVTKYFHEGYTGVELNGKWNFIDKEGKAIGGGIYRWLYDKNNDYVDNFQDGFAVVNRWSRYNYMNKSGKYLLLEWVDQADTFMEGFAGVKRDGKWNFINKKGKFVSNQWFDEIRTRSAFDVDKWFDSSIIISEGYAKVKLNGKWNFINKDGKYYFDKWFIDEEHDAIGCSGSQYDVITQGYARVKQSGKWNFINKSGKYLSDQWFDEVHIFIEGFAVVNINGKCNYMNPQGTYISDIWFDEAQNFNEGFAAVKLQSKWYYIDKRGTFLSANSQ